MPDYDWSSLEAVIIDRQFNTLRLLRDMLGRIGIRTVHALEDPAAARGLLAQRLVDVAFIDAEGPESAIFPLIRNLRHDSDNRNPYLGVFVTAWHPDNALMLRTTNAGADDLLSKPLAPSTVQERLCALVEGRKPFVVTSDFIGPDRRKAPRPGAAIPLVEVPNTVKLKATRQWERVNVADLLGKANTQINVQKVLRGAIQIGFLLDFALPGLSGAPPERMALDHVGRIPAVAADVLRRLPDGPVRERCAAFTTPLLTQLAGVLAADGAPLAAETGTQLRRLALAIIQTVQPERPLEAAIKEISDAVSAYRARLQQITAARQEKTPPAADLPAADPPAPDPAPRTA